MNLVLSLFPGVGMLDAAFEAEGFCVVRGPDVIWGGDIRSFDPPAGRFDGVIGGPPCQAFSALQTLQAARGIPPRHGNLIPEFERVVALAKPAWFVMENVKGAPEPSVSGYHTDSQLIKDFWVGGQTLRMRRFSFGTRDGRRLGVDIAALHTPNPRPAVTSSDGGKGVKMERYTLPEMIELQGFPADFLSESPFTVDGKKKAIGNGVPMAMGRAVAAAVRRAMQPQELAA
jgi:DNA (cytosine-5)-methyltransferase 1